MYLKSITVLSLNPFDKTLKYLSSEVHVLFVVQHVLLLDVLSKVLAALSYVILYQNVLLSLRRNIRPVASVMDHLQQPSSDSLHINI